MAGDGPVCFVTGGASGIGAACVRRMVAEGSHVAFGDLQVEKGTELARELGERAFFSRLDVSVESEFAHALDATVQRWGRLDCLVNNAAVAGVMGPIASIPMDEYDYASNIIQRSVFIGLKHAARVMQMRETGSIVNIASVSGLKGGYGPHVYSACKAAVVALTQSVALELAESGIRVNAVCPGNIETPIHTGVRDQRWTERIAKIRTALVDEQPINRMGLPEEIAAAVLWLASDESSYVTGHALVVDGGQMAGRLWRKQPPFLREFHRAKRLDT
ncbi:MAG: SDR family NAD(P)-dependent oxidoreductase [Burkholderiales bacterium]